jgi:hypothetical protein
MGHACSPPAIALDNQGTPDFPVRLILLAFTPDQESPDITFLDIPLEAREEETWPMGTDPEMSRAATVMPLIIILPLTWSIGQMAVVPPDGSLPRPAGPAPFRPVDQLLPILAAFDYEP